MWVRFTGDYRWRPKPTLTIAYKVGMVQNVTRACAAAAIEAGKAEKAQAPRKASR